MTTIATGAARLNDWGVIRAHGEDAAKFLHSQLTQDFALLGLDEARLAGFCTAKGRLLATMIAWKADAQTVLLALPLELLPAVQKRLSMFVLRAKCKLSDATAEVGLWGVVDAAGAAETTPRWGVLREGAGASTGMSTGMSTADSERVRIRLPDDGTSARWLVAGPMSAAPDLPVISADDWQWSQLEAGLPGVVGATVEQFVPQMLNLELLGGVNFQKGCYPGQEIVARSQYRGTLKRRTYLYETEGPAAAGQEIFHSEDPGQPAGLVANSAQRNGQSLLLAETKIAALAGGSLHLGAPDGPLLRPRALPYELTEPN